MLTGCWSEEFDVGAVLEVQLEVLRIEPKLMKRPANLPGCRVVGRRPSPALVAPFMYELEETAVIEKHSGLVEFRIRDVAGSGGAGEFGLRGHGRTLADLLEFCTQWYWVY